MAEFELEQVIAAPPEAVFAASLDPGLHVRSMATLAAEVESAPRTMSP